MSDLSVLEPSFTKPLHHRLHKLLVPIDHFLLVLIKLYNSLFKSNIETIVLSKMVEEELDYYHDEYMVTILTNYITAHKYAEDKAPFFLGEGEFKHTAEMEAILKDSNECVKRAEALVDQLDKKKVEHHVLKQVSNKVINLQEELISQFLDKGILFAMDAKLLIEEVEMQRDQLEKEHWFLHSYRTRSDAGNIRGVMKIHAEDEGNLELGGGC